MNSGPFRSIMNAARWRQSMRVFYHKRTGYILEITHGVQFAHRCRQLKLDVPFLTIINKSFEFSVLVVGTLNLGLYQFTKKILQYWSEY